MIYIYESEIEVCQLKKAKIPNSGVGKGQKKSLIYSCDSFQTRCSAVSPSVCIVMQIMWQFYLLYIPEAVFLLIRDKNCKRRSLTFIIFMPENRQKSLRN